jgi:uncharacterized phiE125 gp8 family phage protein
MSVVSVSYVDQSGDQQVLDAAAYVLSEGKYLLPVTVWPSMPATPGSVAINYVAGYPAVSEDGPETGFAVALPEDIKLAILLCVSHYYENRTPAALTDRIHGVDALLAPYKAGI